MQSNEISEKEFEFAFDHELINFVGEDNIEVYMPTAAREAQEAFDDRFYVGNPVIYTSLFFQFKKAFAYRNRNSVCGDPLEYHSGTKLKYELHKQRYPDFHSQHNILKDLSDNEDSVFYASPSIIYRKDLLDQVRGHTLLNSSWIFNLRNFPRLQSNDNSTHAVYYPDSGTVGYFCSDLKEIPRTEITRTIREAKSSYKKQDHRREQSEQYLNKLYEKVEKSVMPEYKPKALINGRKWEDLGTVQKITVVLADMFPGLEWILVYGIEEN